MALPADKDHQARIQARTLMGPGGVAGQAQAANEERQQAQKAAAAFHFSESHRAAQLGDRESRDRHMVMVGLHCKQLGIPRGSAHLLLAPHLGGPKPEGRYQRYSRHDGDKYLETT